MKFLVARMDGTPESGFAPGAIKPAQGIPVTRNFDPRLPPIGIADISIEGDRVFATVRLTDPNAVAGLYPAVGGRSASTQFPKPGDHVFVEFDVLTVALCDSPNQDPEIPAIKGGE